MNDEIKELNDEIQYLEECYWDKKGNYDHERAEMLLGTDFASVIGKAKPTIAEKDAYIELHLGDMRKSYHMLKAEIDAKKRLFQILEKEIGDEK